MYFKVMIALKKPSIDGGFKLYSKITCDIWVNHIHLCNRFMSAY